VAYVKQHGLPLIRQVASQRRGTIQIEGCKSLLCVAAISSDIEFVCRVIIDALLYRQIEKGNLIKHVLVANDELSWDKLKVDEDLKKKIEDTQSTIGINYEIQSSTLMSKRTNLLSHFPSERIYKTLR